MYINIRHIIGIPSLHAELLQDAGIYSVEDLIRATEAENLGETVRETGLWRMAVVSYGALARGILAAENDFYRRVVGGSLIFVEDEGEEDPPDEAGYGRAGGGFRYGFKVVGEPGNERHFVRTLKAPRPASGDAVCIPASKWVR